MKKLNFMYIKEEDMLTRDEMKHILAGSDVCRTYSNGSWGGCSWTPEEAQAWYENDPSTTGYCCASCGSDGYSGTTRCY